MNGGRNGHGGSNGQRHLKFIYSLLFAFGAFASITIFEAGGFVKAQESLERDGERRDEQIKVMDARQRLIETQAAVTNSVLSSIKTEQVDIKKDQKEILQILRSRPQ